MTINGVKLCEKFPSKTFFLCKGATTSIGAEEMCKADSRFTYLGKLINTITGEAIEDVVRFKKKYYSLESQSLTDGGCVLCFRNFKLTDDTIKTLDESEYPYFINTADSVFYYKTAEEASSMRTIMGDKICFHNIPK